MSQSKGLLLIRAATVCMGTAGRGASAPVAVSRPTTSANVISLGRISQLYCMSSSLACWNMLKPAVLTKVSRADSPSPFFLWWGWCCGWISETRMMNQYECGIRPFIMIFLGWTARSATSRAWSSLTFEHLLLAPSAHPSGNKDHQRSWSAWQHCTNVKPSPISFRWRRLSLRTKKCVQRAGYLYIATVLSERNENW